MRADFLSRIPAPEPQGGATEDDDRYLPEIHNLQPPALLGKGDELPIALSGIGGRGLARVRGHVKIWGSIAQERCLKAPVSNESGINLDLWYRLVS